VGRRNPSLREAVLLAAEIGPELERLTDQLNVRLRAIEEKLRAAGLHVTVRVEILEGDILAWRKVGDTWGLAIEAAGSDGAKPLLNATRKYRVAAVGVLALLVGELVKAGKAEIERVREAQTTAAALAMTLEGRAEEVSPC
jgi:hypothetical protein